MCLTKKHIGAVHDADGSDADCAFLGSIHDKKASDQWLITLQLGNTKVKFRIDTGADETVIPDHVYNELQDVNPLKEADKKLFGVGSKNVLPVVGMFTAVLQWKNKTTTQNIYVVEGMHKALLGNPAIDELHLISRVESIKGSIDYRGEYPDLFHGLGKMEGPYKITLKDDAQPFAINVPRREAFPLMDKTKKELRRMEDAGVIVRVEQPTDWCAPMVVVPKKDDVRICVDLTKLNESVHRERYEMPSVDYTLGQLSDARIFSKLDANSGFWQVPLADESALLTTIITPLADSVSSDCPSAFHQRRNTSREGCLRSRSELMECYVKWMTYSSSERRKISTMNASVKCLEDSRKRMSHRAQRNVSSRFKKSNSWARQSMSRDSAQIKTRSKQLSTCRNQQMSAVSVDFSE